MRERTKYSESISQRWPLSKCACDADSICKSVAVGNTIACDNIRVYTQVGLCTKSMVNASLECILRRRRRRTEDSYETKHLSSLKFNLKHMADAGEAIDDNHRMHVNETTQNQTKPTQIEQRMFASNRDLRQYSYFSSLWLCVCVFHDYLLPCVDTIFRLL